MSSKPAVVVVTYNAADQLRLCLESVLAHARGFPHDLLVIDNASGDGTRRYLEDLRRNFPGLMFLFNEKNIGFSGAANQAIARLANPWLAFLDDDVMVREGWLSELLKAAERHPRAGVVGCRFVGPDDKVFSAEIALPWGPVGHGDPDAGQWDYVRTCEAVCGACLLVRGDVLDRGIRFDERFYPCQHEDVDFCLQARKAGFQVLYDGALVLQHKHLFRGSGRLARNTELLLDKWNNFSDFPLHDSHPADAQFLAASREAAGENSRPPSKTLHDLLGEHPSPAHARRWLRSAMGSSDRMSGECLEGMRPGPTAKECDRALPLGDVPEPSGEEVPPPASVGKRPTQVPRRKKPHILCVAPRLVNGSLSGGELRILSLLRQLSGRYRFSLMTFLDKDDERRQRRAAAELEEELVEKVHLVPRGGAGGRDAPWFMPDIARWYFDPALPRLLRRAVVEWDMDLVHLEFTEMGQYASATRALAPTLLTEHDAGILSYRSPYVPWSKSWRLHARPWEWARRRIYERRILRDCDGVIAVSPDDAETLSSLRGSDGVHVVPTGVDLAEFKYGGPDGREDGAVLFIGHYPHYPNEAAAVSLCREILPALRRTRPEAHVLLVGSKPTPAVLSLASDSVRVIGTVPDVRPWLGKAMIFLAPLRHGRGIKGKLLEAFACGAPVLSTPQACAGLPDIQDGKQLLIGRNIKELTEKAASLLSERDKGLSIAQEARRYVEERFSWARQAALLDDIYQDVLARNPRVVSFR